MPVAWTASASVPVARPDDSTVCGMPSCSAVASSSSVTAGCSDIPRAITGPEPSSCLVVTELDAGLVGRVGDVDDDRDVGLQAEGARARAGERRLLLRDREPEHVARRAAGGRDEPRRLGGHVGADPVVQRARGDPVVAQRQRRDVDHADVADADQRPRLVAVGGADVDVQVLGLGGLVAVVAAQQVDRLAPDHAAQLAVAGGQDDSLADELDRIPAADLSESDEPRILDVRDVHADLVDVADHRERRAAGVGRAGRYPDDRRADAVGPDVVGEGAGGVTPDLRGRRLVAGRAGRAQQLVEQLRYRHGQRAG